MIDVLQTPLAAGDAGDAIEIVVILAFVVISIVSGIIQKAGKAKKEKAEQEAARQRRRERREAREQAQPVGQGQSAGGQGRAPQSLRPRPAAQVQPFQPLQPLPQVKPQARAKTIRTKSTVRSKRAQPAMADRHVGSAQVGRLHHVDAVQAVDNSLHVDLSARAAARRAMLYHEIFSPPKALRDEKPMWDQ